EGDARHVAVRTPGRAAPLLRGAGRREGPRRPEGTAAEGSIARAPVRLGASARRGRPRSGPYGRERVLVAGVEALRVAEAAGAVAGAARRVGRDVVDDVVGTGSVAGDAPDGGRRPGRGEVVEAEAVADAPGDVVVGAGRVAADADAAADAGPGRGGR